MVLLVSARWCCVRACLVHEYAKENVLSIGTAVRPDEVFNILLLLSVVIVLVVIVIIVVNFETTAFKCFLEIELLLTVIIIVVAIVLSGTLCAEASTGQALVFTDLQLFNEKNEVQ